MISPEQFERKFFITIEQLKAALAVNMEGMCKTMQLQSKPNRTEAEEQTLNEMAEKLPAVHRSICQLFLEYLNEHSHGESIH